MLGNYRVVLSSMELVIWLTVESENLYECDV
jgi:hypothetical protein